MPIFDNQCPECGLIFESVAPYGEHTPCPECSTPSDQIISAGSHYCANQDAPWIRSVLDVVDKESTAPHVVEFRKNPTRSTWKAWMKGEGIRPMEGDERPRPRITEEDRARVNRECADRLYERRSIEINTH